jgi:hypothetical protein
MAGKKKSVSEQLTTSLNGLQAQAENQKIAFRSSREILYETVVDAYLWWHVARDEPGYLDSLYEQHDIQLNSNRTNKPIFSGVLRIVWGMYGSKHQVQISLWNGALGIIHDEYIENAGRYRRDAKQRLINFIEDNGGLSKLRESKGWINDDETYDEPSNASKKTKQKAGIDKKQKDAQIRDGFRHFKSNAKPIGTVDTGAPVVATKDGLVAVLARRNKNGELELLATSDNDAFVAELVSNGLPEDVSNAPSNVTTLVEAISTTTLPYKMRSMAKRLIEKSAYKWTDDEGNQHTASLTALLTIRPKRNDILVSQRRSDVSVVTRLKPTNPLIQRGDDLVFRADGIGYLRRTYVYEKSLPYIKAKPPQRVSKDNTERKATHLIEVTNTESKHKRNLYFYNPHKLFEEQRFQADYNDEVKFVPLWTIDVTPNWLRQLHVEMTSMWINNISPNATRPQHKVFELAFTNTGWETAFSFRDGSYEHYPKTLFDTDCKIQLAGRKQTFKVLSKDYITVFNALYESKITSRKIRIEGNNSVMRISYKTKLGDYTIYVPASISAMHRDDTHFKRYEYV